MDYTVLGLLQARILEWVAFPFSRESSQPRDRTQVSHIADGFFTSWATREALHVNYTLIKPQKNWNFPGGTVDKNPPANVGGGYGSSTWSGNIPHTVGQLSLCALSTEPALVSCTYWSLCTYSLCSATREATQWEACTMQPGVGPAPCSWRKPACSDKDPAQPKWKNYKLNN